MEPINYCFHTHPHPASGPMLPRLIRLMGALLIDRKCSQAEGDTGMGRHAPQGCSSRNWLTAPPNLEAGSGSFRTLCPGGCPQTSWTGKRGSSLSF